MPVTVDFTIDDAAVLAALRACRANIRQDVKKCMLDAANDITLPAVRAITAPSRARGTMIARSTMRGAYITTRARGELRKIVGLLEFGGTVSAKILPVNRQALFFGGGHPVASVSTPRSYKGKHFMQKGVELTLGRFSEHVERQLTKIMNGRLHGAQAFG